MILNGAAIRSAATGFRALFTKGFEAAAPAYPSFVMEVESGGHAETYDFILDLPTVREWVGERQVKNLKVWDYTLTNRDWELTVGVPANLYKDDRLGLVKPKFQAMGSQMALHPDTLFAQLLSGAFARHGYDGVPFISASHPLASGSTKSNIVAGALSESTYRTAVQRIRQMVGWNGEPIDVLAMGGKLCLLVGPALEATARQILLAEYGANGASNIDFGTAALKVFPRITDNKWYLVVQDTPMAAFILQIRERPQVVARDQPDDESVYTRNEVEYGASGRWEMGYGLWQLVVGSAG